MTTHQYISSHALLCRGRRLQLKIRQQPMHTRTSTTNERDRRAIDPPPIVQIQFENSTPIETLRFLQDPNYFMCANLAHPTNDNEVYTPHHNALCGQTVSSMCKLKDSDNHDGAFFILGDLSVKVQGEFRLKLSVFQITPEGAMYLDSIFTNVFTAYTPKQYPGPLDATFLSRSFSDQGARIRIRKDHQHVTRKRKASFDSVDSNSPVSPPPCSEPLKKPCILPSLSQMLAVDEQVDAAVTMMQLRNNHW